MKKTILTTVVFSAIAAFFTYYWTSRNCPEKIIEVEPKNSICLNYDDKVSTLDVGLINRMTGDYQKNKSILGRNKFGNIYDSHSIWFDLETLKKFIYHIEIAAIEKNITPNREKRLGIRMYYADYPEKSTWSGIYEKDLSEFIGHPEADGYANLHTLIMIPTISDNNLNVDFDIRNPEIRGDSIIKQLKILGESRIPGITFSNSQIQSKDNSIRLQAQNHGSLIPPRDGKEEEAFSNQ